MSRSEIQQVLRNWIAQAMSPSGQITGSIDPATWVTGHFIPWWRKHVDGSLGCAEYAAQCLRDELSRMGDSGRLDEALHELTHLQDALRDLRSSLGLDDTKGDSQ